MTHYHLSAKDKGISRVRSFCNDYKDVIAGENRAIFHCGQDVY